MRGFLVCRVGDASRAMRLLMLVAASASLLVAAPSVARATVLPSTISEDTTLTTAESPYTFETVSIESSATLTVDPGVKVIGGDDFSRIFVNGTLKAEGTSESPIVFTSANSEEAGEWRGLVFEPGSGSSVLDHVEVAYGGTWPSR